MKLEVFFILVSIITFIFVILRIRKHKLNIDDSIYWILWSIVLLVLSVFPKLSFKISKLLGFKSTSNFILCLFVFFLYVLIFFQNIKISQLKEKNKKLIQKISIERSIEKK